MFSSWEAITSQKQLGALTKKVTDPAHRLDPNQLQQLRIRGVNSRLLSGRPQEVAALPTAANSLQPHRSALSTGSMIHSYKIINVDIGT